jgi:hypothetical protein
MSRNPTTTLRAWTVRVVHAGVHDAIGRVHGPSERLAREAAIGRYGVSQEEIDAYHAGAAAAPAGIWPGDEFDVVPA